MTSRHLSVAVPLPADTVYAYVRDARHLSEWAAGLSGIPFRQVDGAWTAQTPDGPLIIEFAADNPHGVVDHWVITPDGTRTLNPMRVIPDGDGCEVVFTVRQRAGMSDDEFAADAGLVEADLATLRRVLEG